MKVTLKHSDNTISLTGKGRRRQVSLVEVFDASNDLGLTDVDLANLMGGQEITFDLDESDFAEMNRSPVLLNEYFGFDVSNRASALPGDKVIATQAFTYVDDGGTDDLSDDIYYDIEPGQVFQVMYNLGEYGILLEDDDGVQLKIVSAREFASKFSSIENVQPQDWSDYVESRRGFWSGVDFEDGSAYLIVERAKKHPLGLTHAVAGLRAIMNMLREDKDKVRLNALMQDISEGQEIKESSEKIFEENKALNSYFIRELRDQLKKTNSLSDEEWLSFNEAFLAGAKLNG